LARPERLDGVQQRDPVASVLRDPDAFGVQRARADEVAALDRQVGEAHDAALNTLGVAELAPDREALLE